MGTYNYLHASLVCPRCRASVTTVVDCHFGYTAAMESLRVGDRYPLQPGLPPAESVNTDGEGYIECPRCQRDAFLRVFVRDGVIVGVEPDTEKQGYIPGAAAQPCAPANRGWPSRPFCMVALTWPASVAELGGVRRLDYPAMKVSALILACLLLASPCLCAQVPFRAPPLGPPGLPDQIILAGEFASLGPLPFIKGMTAIQVVLQTGGITDSSPAKLYLIRCGKAERIDLRAVLAGDPSKDRTLQPWDILYLNPHPRRTTRSSEQAGW